MRTFIFILFAITQLQHLSAQSGTKQVKLPAHKSDLNCFYQPKYSTIRRSQFYPFNISGTIKIASFRYHKNNYPIKGDTLLADSLIEIRILTKTEIDKLTDILYNNFYKKQPNFGSLTECFFPRNAILFYNKDGHLKESILLCFHCNRHEESSDKLYFGSDCIQKMDKLQQFFISLGLKFGTDKTIMTYPGESDSD